VTIRVALTHRTTYRFDRPVGLSPHDIRLRPAPHARTPVSGYSLRVEPEKHFLNWQQDPYGNWIARAVFPGKATALSVTVDLVADMTVINPFDFFVDQDAEKFPFDYGAALRQQLWPYLAAESPGRLRTAWLARFSKETAQLGLGTIDLPVELNRRLRQDVGYVVRMEPGVQSPEQTLELGQGSCRDSGWLLVQLLRDLGIAARFASGYLIQLTADQKPLDGPAGPERDFTDLHAWAEAYVPGAGWIGLDPTSGLLAGEGHIPLACTESPATAAPIQGSTDVCGVEFGFEMKVSRIHEDPRVTRPFTPAQWDAIGALADAVETRLEAWDVRLTMGGEPTFVSIDDMDGEEWSFSALGDAKRKLAGDLLIRLKQRFAPGGLTHYGQGKWYPGEPLPRWALGCYWRTDGRPLWKEDRWLGEAGRDDGSGPAEAQRFIHGLAGRLGLHPDHVIAAYEDVWKLAQDEQKLPANIDPLAIDLADAPERRRLASLLQRGLAQVAGFVLPLKAAPRPWHAGEPHWQSSLWPLKRDHLYLVAGDSPMGYRLPLDSLPWSATADEEIPPPDPFEEKAALDQPAGEVALKARKPKALRLEVGKSAPKLVRTALCVQPRGGTLHVFLPPMTTIEDWIELVAAVEGAAAETGVPVAIEGYQPPLDPRLQRLFVTPDPGVIEVNVHPARSWREVVEHTRVLYEEARAARLGTEKFMIDGRHSGTGGGNHVTIGGLSPADSPLLRRPDLLRSLIAYWQNHPSLSYLFSGMFIGPTSQAPRVDEARDDNLYELEIAFQEMDRRAKPGEESLEPWLVDRLLRHLLTDVAGNTHRCEFSIDKLYSPDGPAGRLGLLEFRAFEMPPHWQMSALQMLLLRALIARFWKSPYRAKLARWGTGLHDRFLLPHLLAEDFADVIRDLNETGYAFRLDWFAAFFEFRFPRYGTVIHDGVEIELRQALEPWHVLGEEAQTSGTTRYVDSSVERLQVRVNRMGARHAVACNGRPLPLAPTGRQGEFVAGVRYKAWKPPSSLHPTIDVHTPLVFDLVDLRAGRSVGGCTYHVSHPGGRNYERLPVNAFEAEARRVARFLGHGHTAGPMTLEPAAPSGEFPLTLDLRREPDAVSVFSPAQSAAAQQQ